MNFKPNIKKVIGTIIFGLFIIIIATIIIDQNCMPKMGSTCPIFSEETFYYLLAYFEIPILIIIYIIWSLIETAK